MTDDFSDFDASGLLGDYTSTEGTPTNPSCGSSTAAFQFPEANGLGVLFDSHLSAISSGCNDHFFADTFTKMTEREESHGIKASQEAGDSHTATTEDQPSNIGSTNQLQEGSGAHLGGLSVEKRYERDDEIPESPDPRNEVATAPSNSIDTLVTHQNRQENSNASIQQAVQERNAGPTPSADSRALGPDLARPAMLQHSLSSSETYQSPSTPRQPSQFRHSTVQGNMLMGLNGQLQSSVYNPQAYSFQHSSHRTKLQESSPYPNRVQHLAFPHDIQDWRLPQASKFIKSTGFEQHQANQMSADVSGAYHAHVVNPAARFTGHGNGPQLTNTFQNNNMTSQQTFLRNSHPSYINRSLNNSLSGPSTPLSSATIATPMSYPYPYHSSLVSPYATLQMPGTQSSSEDESIESLKHHMYDLSDHDKRPLSQQEQQWVEDMKAAMCDMQRATDNEGMKRTWSGLMKQTSRLNSTCRSLLYVCRKADNSDSPLQSAVKPVNHFATMEERINHICASLREQKTMCKHLMEWPYIFQVVDDPVQAAHRITNNRRVNKQKREAIELGRKQQIIEGSVRNRRRVKSESEEDDDGGIEYDNEEEAEAYPESENASTPRHKQARSSPAINRIIRRSDSEDYKPPRKRRNQSRSIYQVNADGLMVDTTSLPTSAPRASGQPNAYQAYTQQGYYPPGYGVRRLGDYGQPSTPSDADDDGDDDGDWQPTDQPGQKRARRGNDY